MERTIINELMLVDEIFYKMLVASQKGKPLFVPEKNKLLGAENLPQDER